MINAISVELDYRWKFFVTTWKALLACIIPFGTFMLTGRYLERPVSTVSYGSYKSVHFMPAASAYYTSADLQNYWTRNMPSSRLLSEGSAKGLPLGVRLHKQYIYQINGWPVFWTLFYGSAGNNAPIFALPACVFRVVYHKINRLGVLNIFRWKIRLAGCKFNGIEVYCIVCDRRPPARLTNQPDQ